MKGISMRHLTSLAAVALGTILAIPAFGATVYNNLTPNNLMAMATRPDSGGAFEIEAADDFILASPTTINSASFTGLITGGGAANIAEVIVEIYRVFPSDSDVGRTSGPATFSTSEVPTRVNSPSDVAFASRDSA